MAGEVDKTAIIHDEAVRILAHDGRLHAVVEDLPRNAAEIGESSHVASQHRAEVLMDNEAAPHQPRVAQHERKQPHDAFGAWLVGELDLEAGQIHLGLQAGRRFEAHLDRQGNGLRIPTKPAGYSDFKPATNPT